MTSFPAKLESETAFPSASANVNAGADFPSSIAIRSARLAHEVELRLLTRLAVLVELPGGGEVIGVLESERRLVHVAVVRRLEVPSAVELEENRAGVAVPVGFHARLVPFRAIVRQHEVALVDGE